MKEKSWEELKKLGSAHYKGTAQPIDIYKSKGVFKPFALCSIAKYATRNMDKEINPADMDKIIHYAELLKAERKTTNLFEKHKKIKKQEIAVFNTLQGYGETEVCKVPANNDGAIVDEKEIP